MVICVCKQDIEPGDGCVDILPWFPAEAEELDQCSDHCFDLEFPKPLGEAPDEHMEACVVTQALAVVPVGVLPMNEDVQRDGVRKVACLSLELWDHDGSLILSWNLRSSAP